MELFDWFFHHIKQLLPDITPKSKLIPDMNHRLITYLLSLFALASIVACNGESEMIRIASPQLEMKAEGPLFEGANTVTASWEFDLNTLLGQSQNLNLKSAKLSSVEIILEDAENLPGLENMVFELTSKNTPMTRLGLFEGKINANVPFQLSLAAKQENLNSAFEDGKITFVGDFDLQEAEYWEDINFSLKAVFELEIKK
jgi:hypothetical protein